MRWRPGLARTVRGPHDLQLGCGSGAVVLEGLTAADWQLLALLERAPSAGELAETVRRLGLPGPRARTLLELLAGAGALAGTGGFVGPVGRAAPVAGGGPAAARARDGARGPGRPSLAGAQVAVVGGAGLGVALTVALAAAGASRSALVDDATVSAHDVLPGGAQHGDVGRRAAHVAAEAVHRLRPDVRTACPEDPDLVVLVSAHVPDAPAGIPLVQRGTLHLPVVVRPDEVVVGPLVVPGRGPCLHCLDLHHRDLDPGWADAVRQLRRESRRVRQPGAAATALTSGLLAVLAGAPHAADRAGVEVHLGPGGATDWRRWSAHPVCGCVGWPEPDPDDDPDPDPDPAAVGARGAEQAVTDPPAPTTGTGATMAA